MRLPSNLSRRAFITGIGGATVALPFLPSLFPRDVKAATERPRYCVYVRQANGCAQADNGDVQMGDRVIIVYDGNGIARAVRDSGRRRDI